LTHQRLFLPSFFGDPRHLLHYSNGVIFGDVDWDAYRRWLFARFSYKYAVDCYAYARRYAHLLFSRRLAEIEGLPAKRHILMALANLSKFLGVYREFKMMVEDAGLSWSSGSKSNNFMSVFLNENVDVAFKYARQILESNVDDDVKRIVRFLFFGGLRPCEALLTFKCLAEGRDGFLDEERMLLHYWKLPEFQRGGKKVFLTVLTKTMLEDLKCGLHVGWYYEKLKRKLHGAGLPVNLYVFRKAWATFMRMNGLEQELVNLFQGRAPKTIFEQSYFRPVLDEAILKVRTLVEKMEQEWSLKSKRGGEEKWSFSWRKKRLHGIE
jgi:intergrase/recombinase